MNKIFSEQYVATISFLWVVFMACLLILKRDTLGKLGLNEIGDALAGAFAPLGFFWLVAGFYQQGKGLEQNSEALRMQALELQSSTQALNDQVVEQRNLLVTTKDQIKVVVEKNDFERFVQKKKFQPFFHIKKLSIEHYVTGIENIFSELLIDITISNSRAVCRNVFFSYNFEGPSGSDFLFNERGFDLISNTPDTPYCEKLILKKEPEFDEDNKCLMILRISYCDELDTYQNQCISLFLERKFQNSITLSTYQIHEQSLY